MTNTSEKSLSTALVSTGIEDDAEDEDIEELKEERKERERLNKVKNENEAFSKFMTFRNIFYTADNGVVLLAEHHHQYRHVSVTTTGTQSMGRTTTTTYAVDECGELLACKVDASGNIAWLTVLPKFQREITPLTHSNTPFYLYGYFDRGNHPFYAGFGALQNKGKVQLFLNDNPRNAHVTQAGQKAKWMRRFDKSDCFVLTIDEATGKVTRAPFFSNRDIPTAMPRLGVVMGNNMYIVGKQDRQIARTKILVGKITVR